jgi:hypothetical protein
MTTIIRVFPRRTSLTPTDDMAFIGDPPMMRPAADEVHVSCTFTWDKERAERLARAWGQYYPVVKLGGPAFESSVNGFVPGQYVKAGVTFTSRGCNNDCPWCLVRSREGKLSEDPNFPAGNIINDNNLLQCSAAHRDSVFAMLASQHMIYLHGGIDARLVTDRIADQLRALRIRELFLAADTKQSLRALERATRTIKLPRQKMRCYVLLAFDGQTISEAQAQLEAVWALGCMPHAQLYQAADKRIKYSQAWRDLARTWSRPAAMKAEMGRRRNHVADHT